MKKTGLFFGSFNPVHNGHMIIANFMATQTDLDEVWMVVTPQNPLKNKKSLLEDRTRLHLVYLAIGSKNYHLKPSDIEFKLPKPSFTIDTLAYLREKNPNRAFVLIMGGDNLATISKWKNYEIILRDFEIYVYERPNFELGNWENYPNVKIFEAPQMNISSSYIRNCIKNNFPIEFLVPPKVEQYILKNYLYL